MFAFADMFNFLMSKLACLRAGRLSFCLIFGCASKSLFFRHIPPLASNRSGSIGTAAAPHCVAVRLLYLARQLHLAPCDQIRATRLVLCSPGQTRKATSPRPFSALSSSCLPAVGQHRNRSSPAWLQLTRVPKWPLFFVYLSPLVSPPRKISQLVVQLFASTTCMPITCNHPSLRLNIDCCTKSSTIDTQSCHNSGYCRLMIL